MGRASTRPWGLQIEMRAEGPDDQVIEKAQRKEEWMQNREIQEPICLQGEEVQEIPPAFTGTHLQLPLPSESSSRGDQHRAPCQETTPPSAEARSRVSTLTPGRRGEAQMNDGWGGTGGLKAGEKGAGRRCQGRRAPGGSHSARREGVKRLKGSSCK